MNHIWGIMVECCFLFSFLLDTMGFAQMDHSIEDGTAQATFDLLVPVRALTRYSEICVSR